MKKYFTFTNIMLMLFPVAALIISIVFGNTLAIAISGAFIICTGGLIYVMTKLKEALAQNQELADQLEQVRKNRDDYMFLYKEYWNKYDAKVSECGILDQKLKDLQAISETLASGILEQKLKEPAMQAAAPEVQKGTSKRQKRSKKSVQEIKTDLLEKRAD